MTARRRGVGCRAGPRCVAGAWWGSARAADYKRSACGSSGGNITFLNLLSIVLHEASLRARA